MPASKDRVTINVEKSYLFPHYLKVEAKNTLAAAISDVWITNPFNTGKNVVNPFFAALIIKDFFWKTD